MARKIYEISFAIAGSLASSFKGSFSSADTVIRSMQSSMRNLNEQFKQGSIDAEKYQSQYTKLMKRMDQANKYQNKNQNPTSTFAAKAEGAIKNSASAISGHLMGIAAAGAGALGVGGAGYFLGQSLGKAMDYEQELSNIQALTGATGKQMQDMSTLALKMGTDTSFSALQAAQGIEELLKAGLTPAQVQAGGLEASLNLATAGGLDLADAADIMSNSLNGFKDNGMSAAQVANILAGAANASSADVQTLEYGLAAVGPVADGLGVSFKAVNATLAAFSNNALKGQDAGTSLKTFLQNVQPQTKQATALFEKYGLVTKNGTNILFNANGELKDMADVAQILQTHFKDLNDQQRSNAFFNMFGTDAVRAANILFKEGAAGIKDMYDQMSKVTALDVAKQKMNNAAGAVEQFKGAVETLQISALMPTLPIIKNLASGAADFVSKYTPQITQSVQSAINGASSYIHTHFIDNPEFQHLPDLSSKINFIFDDLGKAFDKWWKQSGSDEMSNVASKAMSWLGTFLTNNEPTIAAFALEVGTDIGESLIQGIWNGITKSGGKASFSDALEKTFAGGMPGLPILEKFMKDKFNVSLDWNVGGPSSSSGTSAPSSSSPSLSHGQLMPGQLAMHARGGIFSSPHIGMVAEAGPEAIIPLRPSANSKSIWQRAGKAIGGSSGSGSPIQLTYAPVIYGSGSDIKPILQEHSKDLESRLASIAHQGRRLSYSGG